MSVQINFVYFYVKSISLFLLILFDFELVYWYISILISDHIYELFALFIYFNLNLVRNMNIFGSCQQTTTVNWQYTLDQPLFLLFLFTLFNFKNDLILLSIVAINRTKFVEISSSSYLSFAFFSSLFFVTLYEQLESLWLSVFCRRHLFLLHRPLACCRSKPQLPVQISQCQTRFWFWLSIARSSFSINRSTNRLIAIVIYFWLLLLFSRVQLVLICSCNCILNKPINFSKSLWIDSRFGSFLCVRTPVIDQSIDRLTNDLFSLVLNDYDRKVKQAKSIRCYWKTRAKMLIILLRCDNQQFNDWHWNCN